MFKWGVLDRWNSIYRDSEVTYKYLRHWKTPDWGTVSESYGEISLWDNCEVSQK